MDRLEMDDSDIIEFLELEEYKQDYDNKKKLIDKEGYIDISEAILEVIEIINYVSKENYTNNEICEFKKEVREELNYI